jgi:hypothetical protein
LSLTTDLTAAEAERRADDAVAAVFEAWYRLSPYKAVEAAALREDFAEV